MDQSFSLTSEDRGPPMLSALERALPNGVVVDLAIVGTLLAEYSSTAATAEADRAWSSIGHYRLAVIAASRAEKADPATSEFDLFAGAALRHVAESVFEAGWWLAEALDLRLPQRVRPELGNRELVGRVVFLDPVLGSALQKQRVWLTDIAGIGRRVMRAPINFRADGSRLIPAPRGTADVAEALSAHLEELRACLAVISQAVEHNRAVGGRVRETPDEAWLND